jgi:hypothetical protein
MQPGMDFCHPMYQAGESSGFDIKIEPRFSNRGGV